MKIQILLGKNKFKNIFFRVSHSKYIVSDSRTYITTNNWNADYFVNTGGVSISMINDDIQSQAKKIYDRDWYGPTTYPANFTDNH